MREAYTPAFSFVRDQWRRIMDESHTEGNADRRMRSDRRGESEHKHYLGVERRARVRREREGFWAR